MFNIQKTLNLPTKICLFHGIHRFTQQNHYEVLNLKQECTHEEIRQSFVKLSKLYHPDSHQQIISSDTRQFSAIMEAYKVLGRKESRAAYDNILTANIIGDPNDYSSYYGIHKPKDNVNAPPDEYYGIKGIHKLANWKIVCLIAGIITFGISAQLVAVLREELDRRSQIAGKQLNDLKTEAEMYGNNQQLERMKQRLSMSE